MNFGQCNKDYEVYNKELLTLREETIGWKAKAGAGIVKKLVASTFT